MSIYILLVLITFFTPVLFSGINQPINANSIQNDVIVKINNVASENRSYQIFTNGTTTSFLKNGFSAGWFSILQMLKPFPDQMFFSLFSCIHYEDGETTIFNIDTGETIHRDGTHTVIVYNFYGPVLSFKLSNVAAEGNAIFAMVIGGK